MTITIHGGHGYPGKGAVGVVSYINESIQDRIVASKVESLLKLDGHAVTNITVDEGSASSIVSNLAKRANATKADLNVSIHFNSSGKGTADGVEVLVKPGDAKAKKYAMDILDGIVRLGFKNRGIKERTDLYILNNMKTPTVLIECCFADSQADFRKYDATKMSYAIACAIAGHAIVEVIPVKKHTKDICDTSPHDDLIPMFRLYNPNTGDHFFTQGVIESDILIDAGWTCEGIGWYAPCDSGIPIHRLYNPNSGEHHFTASDGESVYLANLGWIYEGVAFLSDKKERVPVYRLYNEQTGKHTYTDNDAEKESLIKIGWIFEGVGWYGGAI